MKILLSIFCLLILVSCSNEVPYDKLVERDGVFYEDNSTTPFTGRAVERFDENGQLKGRANYKDGKEDGLIELFYENGQPSLRGNFSNGKPDGLMESFYKNGQLKELTHFKGVYRVGIYKTYSERGRLLKHIEYFLRESKDGKKEEIGYGFSQDYDENTGTGARDIFNREAKLVGKGNWKEGKKDGLWEHFYTNKFNAAELDYIVTQALVKEGKKEGKEASNYNSVSKRLGEHLYNPQLEKRGNYKNGKKEGLWQTFYVQKRPCEILGRDFGTCVRSFNRKPAIEASRKQRQIDRSVTDPVLEQVLERRGKFQPIIDGVISKSNLKEVRRNTKEVRWFKSSLAEGVWVDGRIQKKGTYKNGKKDGLWEYFHFGKSLIRPRSDSRENWDYTAFDGQLALRGTYKKGIKDGLWEFFSEHDGQQEIKVNYKNGIKDGIWELFLDPYGNRTRAKRNAVVIKGTYKNGKKEGLWEYFNEDGPTIDGKRKQKGHYKDGKKDGLWEVELMHGRGSVGEEVNWKEGKAEGSWSIYGRNFIGTRVLQQKGHYKDGKKDGLWEFSCLAPHIVTVEKICYKNDFEMYSQSVPCNKKAKPSYPIKRNSYFPGKFDESYCENYSSAPPSIFLDVY